MVVRLSDIRTISSTEMPNKCMVWLYQVQDVIICNPILNETNSLEDIFQGLGRRSLKYKGEASQANRQYSLGRFIVTEAYAPFVLFPWCVMMPASAKVT